MSLQPLPPLVALSLSSRPQSWPASCRLLPQLTSKLFVGLLHALRMKNSTESPVHTCCPATYCDVNALLMPALLSDHPLQMVRDRASRFRLRRRGQGHCVSLTTPSCVTPAAACCPSSSCPTGLDVHSDVRVALRTMKLWSPSGLGERWGRLHQPRLRPYRVGGTAICQLPVNLL